MTLKIFIHSFYFFSITVIIGYFVLLYAEPYLHYLYRANTNESSLYFTEDRLSMFDGIRNESLYLSIMGNIFNVTKGKRHYQKGSPYNAFIGRDASRLFITGEFEGPTYNIDDVLDFPCKDLLNLKNWLERYRKDYVFVGYLIGRFFNNKGIATQYKNDLEQKIIRCRNNAIDKHVQKHNFPPCNKEWSESKGTRVWCTNKSGGIMRDWIGVPRLLFTHGVKYTKCVCINLDHSTDGEMIKEYEGCHSKSRECFIEDF